MVVTYACSATLQTTEQDAYGGHKQLLLNRPIYIFLYIIYWGDIFTVF